MNIERLDHNMVKLTIEASAEDFEKAMQQAYLKNKNRIQIQGFRKGKAPRVMIEKMYGPEVFYEDAANALIPDAYAAALETEECKALDIVSQPEIDVVQIEKGKEFIFTAEVAVRPEVTLGEYMNLGIEKKTAEVSDEEVEQELQKTREQNAHTITVEDRPAEIGDIAVIDYEGFCDGVAFDGGKGENHELELGSHSFIDTFEDQIAGKNIGDEFDVNVTFPEEYHSADLAGKPAVFKVKLNSIKKKELPELDDEFAEEVSDFDTLDEYRADVKKNLAEKKQGELNNEYRDEVLKKAVENAEMDIPQAMIDDQARQLVNEQAQRMQQMGISLEDYMKYTGQSMTDLQNQMKDQAETRIKNSLVLAAIAKKENIEISEEEVKTEIENMAKMYQMDTEKMEEYLSDTDRDNIRKDLAIQKAVELISK